MKKLSAEPLTSSAFAPFGQVITSPTSAPSFRNEGGTQGWGFSFTSGRPLIMLLETPPGEHHVNKLEAHFNVTQTFLPIGGSSAALIVAPRTETGCPPRPEEARAFLLDGTAGYILATGIWHSLDRLPLGGTATRWVMITDEETQQDLPLADSGKARLTRQADLETEWGFSLQVESPSFHA